MQGEEALLRGKLCFSHSSGSAGVWRAETCSDVSEEADCKGKEEHRSVQDQEMHTLDAFIHKA